MKSLHLQNKKVLLCVTGGIAAYKACLLLRELQKSEAIVKVAMTKSAQNFVGVETFKALTREEVFTNIFNGDGFPHIDYPHWADILVIAPCTGNTMAKLAHGLGDDPVSLSFLAADCPRIVVPAMNPSMYNAIATQENIKTLRKRGFEVIEAEAGEVACGDTGTGRFPEIDVVVNKIRDVLRLTEKLNQKNNIIYDSLKSKKVLITAGRTEEAIDPVRSIVNRSSGKTAIALANAFYDAGAEVIFIYGPMDVKTPSFSTNISINSALEMYDEVMKNSKSADILIMNAAVADFRPVNCSDVKIKNSNSLISIDLEPNPNILQELISKKKSNQTIVGFALETENIVENANNKLKKSPCDLMVLNLPAKKDSGFGKEEAICAIVVPGEKIDEDSLKLMNKFDLAKAVVKAVDQIVSIG